MRLVNDEEEEEEEDSSSPTSGRLEVCFNRAWGTVCLNQFSVAAAAVICRQLGSFQDGYGACGTEIMGINHCVCMCVCVCVCV